MPSIPVPSSEPANSVLQSSFYDRIERDSERVAVLEKSATDQVSGLLTQVVTNGDTDQAPSGNAVFDYGTTVQAAAVVVANAYTDSKRLTATAALDFSSLGAFLAANATIAVPGAATGDSVALGPPAAINAGLLWCGFVSAANTVTIRIYNLTGVAIDPPSQTWRVTVFK